MSHHQPYTSRMDEIPQHHTWINPERARYYHVHLDRDLFGDWTLCKVWGGLHSRRGRMHRSGVPSYDAGVRAIEDIRARRTHRGYQSRGTS